MAKKDYSVRKWMVPKKRAESYAKDRKQKVHTYGPKEGQELTDYEAGSFCSLMTVYRAIR